MISNTCLWWLIVAFLAGSAFHWTVAYLINRVKAIEEARIKERKERLRNLTMKKILINRARRRREKIAKLQLDKTDGTQS